MCHDILMLLKTFPPSFSRLFISEDLFQWPFSMFIPDVHSRWLLLDAGSMC